MKNLKNKNLHSDLAYRWRFYNTTDIEKAHSELITIAWRSRPFEVSLPQHWKHCNMIFQIEKACYELRIVSNVLLIVGNVEKFSIMVVVCHQISKAILSVHDVVNIYNSCCKSVHQWFTLSVLAWYISVLTKKEITKLLGFLVSFFCGEELLVCPWYWLVEGFVQLSGLFMFFIL